MGSLQQFALTADTKSMKQDLRLHITAMPLVGAALLLSACASQIAGPEPGEADARKACEQIHRYVTGGDAWAHEFNEDAKAAAAVNPKYAALASRTQGLREMSLGSWDSPEADGAEAECVRLFPPGQ